MLLPAYGERSSIPEGICLSQNDIGWPKTATSKPAARRAAAAASP